jgi:hypothetical protein
MLERIVERKLLNAFPAVPVPDRDVVVEDTYETDHLHELLAGRRWDKISVEDYRYCDDGFSLLTVVGLHYYLPGYLISEIRDSETSDILAQYATFTLADDGSEFTRKRLDSLGGLVTVEQIEGIALWLCMYAQRYGETNDKHVRKSFTTLDEWFHRIENS